MSWDPNLSLFALCDFWSLILTPIDNFCSQSLVSCASPTSSFNVINHSMNNITNGSFLVINQSNLSIICAFCVCFKLIIQHKYADDYHSKASRMETSSSSQRKLQRPSGSKPCLLLLRYHIPHHHRLFFIYSYSLIGTS